MPSGGPKDTTPPKVLYENPPNGTTLFSSNKFSIRFDEFVELDKINEQLLISPPMLKMPDFHLKGKTLTVKFNETLKSNTTYSIYFGSAIVDITEKNPLNNYTYIFSTGKTIDSLSLTGVLVNAFDLKPVENAYVMLYKNNNDTLSLDSLPLFVKPYYLSKTDKTGRFKFRALANDKYLIFGLNDQNNSLTFDQPQENIAFIDSLVRPQYIKPAHVNTEQFDTLKGLSKDSLSVLIDSLTRISDSLNNAKMINYNLYMFVNQDTVQKLIQVQLLKKDILRFVFSLPATSVSIINLTNADSMLNYVEERNNLGDTLLWFLKEPHPDTLNLVFMKKTDTLDKVKVRVIPKEKFVKRRAKKNQSKPEYLNFHANVSDVIKPNQKLKLMFDRPISHFYSDSVLLIKGNDSIFNPEYYFNDSLQKSIIFPFTVKQATVYRFIIPDSVLFDWNGITNKKINLSFKTKNANEYGKLTLQLVFMKKQAYIVQMLDDKDKLVSQKFIDNDTTLIFSYINPAKYRFKLIFDDNDNHRWDTGNYFKKRQPEKVIFFNKILDIKANWEYEEKWNVDL